MTIRLTITIDKANVEQRATLDRIQSGFSQRVEPVALTCEQAQHIVTDAVSSHVDKLFGGDVSLSELVHVSAEEVQA